MALRFDGNFQGPEALIAAAQNVTVNWVDLGDVQDIQGAGDVALFLDVTINDSTNVRFRMLLIPVAGGVEYSTPIRTGAADWVRIQPEQVELAVDADQSIAYSWEIDGMANFVQFQVQAGVVGATAGTVDEALVTTGRF